jgi:arylsulfatase A-like enzyme
VSRRPNIVVLILDSLRAAQMSCYGYSRVTTPNLDAFAREGVLFRRVFSPATWTIPSHASLLTGLYVSQHRIESIEAERRFNEAIVTLPELLRRHGYRTAAFSHNPLFSPSQGLGDGFEEFHEMDGLAGGRLDTRLFAWLIERLSGLPRALAQYGRRRAAPRLTLDAVHSWIARLPAGAPYFVFANLLAPHFPWAVPGRALARAQALRPRYLLRRDFLTLKDNWKFNAGVEPVTDAHRDAWRRLYDAAVIHVDQEVGRFLTRLRLRPDADNTIVVITSDHGEMLGERGDVVGHVLTLHDNVTHVPLLIRHPAYRPGLEVETIVQVHDLYATVVDWSDVPTGTVPSAQLHRPTFDQAIEGGPNSKDYAFAEEDYSDSYNLLEKLHEVNPELDLGRFPTTQRMVRSATHKYVSYVGGSGDGELYSLVDDPSEEHNLLAPGAERDVSVLTHLANTLSTWQKGLELFPPRSIASEEGLDDVTVERLRALGYIP